MIGRMNDTVTIQQTCVHKIHTKLTSIGTRCMYIRTYSVYGSVLNSYVREILLYIHTYL